MVITISAAALYLADKLVSVGLEKGLDEIISIGKNTFAQELEKVIFETIAEYKKLYPVEENGAQFPFYDSQILLQELLQFQVFHKSHKINQKTLEQALSKNSNIISPQTKEIEAFLCLFNEKVKSNTNLKNLAIEEDYKEEIFRIAEEFCKLLQKLSQMEAKLDLVLEGVTNLNENRTSQSASKIIFEEYINSLKHVSSETTPKSQFYYKSNAVPFVQRKEWGELTGFCENPAEILWWAITGPGGSGKAGWHTNLFAKILMTGK